MNILFNLLESISNKIQIIDFALDYHKKDNNIKILSIELLFLIIYSKLK